MKNLTAMPSGEKNHFHFRRIGEKLILKGATRRRDMAYAERLIDRVWGPIHILALVDSSQWLQDPVNQYLMSPEGYTEVR